MKLSVKAKVTLWFTALMGAVSGLALALLLLVSQSVVDSTAMETLSQTVRESLSQVGEEQGNLSLSGEFSFYRDGVYLLVYSKEEALLAGQLPGFFTGVEEPFQNGLTRGVDTPQGHCYVLDFFVPFGWEDGVWVRGIIPAGGAAQTSRNVMTLGAVALPLLLVLAAAGGYAVARRAFRPLDQMAATASAIQEGSDLSARIPVGKGHNEFTRLAGTFNQMLQRLEGSFQAEERFSSDASHELRTPMSVIMAQCELSLEEPQSAAEYVEALEVIQRQGRKMTKLINDMLDFTRLEMHAERYPLEATDLSGLTESICADMALIRDQDIALTWEVEPGITVRGNRDLLSRMLTNLISNAYRYGKPGGHIRVSLGRTGGGIELAVADDGIGIAPEEQEKIFRRFYQSDRSRSGAGTGLGLSMVQEIARFHGGEIRLESALGQGSTFTFFLPEKNLPR